VRQQAWGHAILERLHHSHVPVELARQVRAFKAAQGALRAATKRARAARERRDGALAAIGRADGSLEKALLSLAKRLAQARLPERGNPFAKVSALGATQILALEPVRAALETDRLLARLRSSTLPLPVKKAMTACSDAVKGVLAASGRGTAAQAEYVKALAARDELLNKWSTALARLRRAAERVYRESPDEVARLFAAPEEQEPETVFDLQPVLPPVMNGVHTV
jgi:hypothetical protein